MKVNFLFIYLYYFPLIIFFLGTIIFFFWKNNVISTQNTHAHYSPNQTIKPVNRESVKNPSLSLSLSIRFATRKQHQSSSIFQNILVGRKRFILHFKLQTTKTLTRFHGLLRSGPREKCTQPSEPTRMALTGHRHWSRRSVSLFFPFC